MEAQRGDKHIIINDSPATYASDGIMVYKMRMNKEKLEGYQRLDQDFFRLCKIRKIKGETRTFLIYLRGLYCYFGKPYFYCPDKSIIDDLSISSMTLNRSRKFLQQRGIIEYKSSQGRGKAIEYLILKTELAPEIKPNKMLPFNKQNVRFSSFIPNTKTYQNVSPRVIRVNKEKEQNFQGAFTEKKEIRFNPEVCNLIKETTQKLNAK